MLLLLWDLALVKERLGILQTELRVSTTRSSCRHPLVPDALNLDHSLCVPVRFR